MTRCHVHNNFDYFIDIDTGAMRMCENNIGRYPKNETVI